MQLSELDLNLLVAFDALLQEGSVTRAARRVGVSQPAMSNALRRLRTALGDELMVRAGGGMVPTPRALELHGPVRAALATLHRALNHDGRFDPSSAKRAFRIASSDYAEMVLLPGLVEGLRQQAPGVDLTVRAMGGELPRTALSGGGLDLAIGVFRDVPAGHVQQALFRDRFVCVARQDHPALADGLDLDTYCELDHVLISATGRGPGVVDHFLEQQGRSRRVALRVPHFIVAPMVIARTDMVLTLASRLACRLAPMLGLQVLPPPLDLPTFTIRQLWHERYRHDAGHRFLRAQVAAVAQGVADPEDCEHLDEP